MYDCPLQNWVVADTIYSFIPENASVLLQYCCMYTEELYQLSGELDCSYQEFRKACCVQTNTKEDGSSAGK